MENKTNQKFTSTWDKLILTFTQNFLITKLCPPQS